jgi:hypothetical protein
MGKTFINNGDLDSKVFKTIKKEIKKNSKNKRISKKDFFSED